jgi:hypothetical protein
MMDLQHFVPSELRRLENEAVVGLDYPIFTYVLPNVKSGPPYFISI